MHDLTLLSWVMIAIAATAAAIFFAVAWFRASSALSEALDKIASLRSQLRARAVPLDERDVAAIRAEFERECGQ